MRAALIACVLPILAATEVAAQDRSCGRFSWSVGHAIDLFADYLPTVTSAQSLPKEGVFSLILKPAADVIYAVAPERGSDGGYGGIVTIESVPAGRYQVALSEDAWVDAVQGNARLQALAHDRDKDCVGVRRSVHIEAKGEPITIQISGAAVPRISIALVRVWPFDWKW